MFYEHFTEFKRKFKEVMDWHETKKVLVEKRSRNLEVKQLTNKIKFGINKLDEYLRYMQKAMNHVNKKTQKNDASKANALKKCQELRDIIVKKESDAVAQPRGKDRNIADVQLELMTASRFEQSQKKDNEKEAKDEDKILKEWAEALDEMVR